jgi:hypothetical protein
MTPPPGAAILESIAHRLIEEGSDFQSPTSTDAGHASLVWVLPVAFTRANSFPSIGQ